MRWRSRSLIRVLSVVSGKRHADALVKRSSGHAHFMRTSEKEANERGGGDGGTTCLRRAGRQRVAAPHATRNTHYATTPSISALHTPAATVSSCINETPGATGQRRLPAACLAPRACPQPTPLLSQYEPAKPVQAKTDYNPNCERPDAIINKCVQYGFY